MNKAVITRFSDNGRETIGTMVATRADGQTWTRHTLEKPWLGNQRNISCVPAGTYNVALAYMGILKAMLYCVAGVIGRDGIFFHWGNFVKDTDGCILIGKLLADIDGNGTVDISDTHEAVASLHAFYGGVPFQLQINSVISYNMKVPE